MVRPGFPLGVNGDFYIGSITVRRGRDAAAACGVSLKTSFSMRHRLCEVMASMLPAFEAGPGCPVEADETLVPDSLSGNHSRSAGFPCPAPHAGAGATGPLPA